jgi:hypothetical protein
MNRVEVPIEYPWHLSAQDIDLMLEIANGLNLWNMAAS